MLIRLLTMLIALHFSYNVAAQTQNNDYYAAKSDPRLAQLLHNVEEYHMQPGLDQIKTGQYYSAWGSFDFILRYFPNHPRALPLMSDLCQIYKDRRCNAEAYFDKALRINPNNSSIYLIKGIYLQKRGKLDEAIESYKKSLDINPDSANAHYNLGLAYLAQKQNSDANEHAQKAYAIGIPFPGLRNKLIAAGAWHPVEAKPDLKTASPIEIVQPRAEGVATGDSLLRPADSAGKVRAEAETKNADVSK